MEELAKIEELVKSKVSSAISDQEAVALQKSLEFEKHQRAKDKAKFSSIKEALSKSLDNLLYEKNLL